MTIFEGTILVTSPEYEPRLDVILIILMIFNFFFLYTVKVANEANTVAIPKTLQSAMRTLTL